MPIDPKRVQAVFLLAVEAADPTARAAILDRESGADAELSQRVEALLRAHDAPGAVLGETGAPLLGEGDSTEAVGSHIGSYKLLQKLGEGGMGVVWVAEQTEPVRRRVALKVIKPGMDSRQVIARFETERQALALMDHPNIAKVLDAGATDGGLPYFVMELIHGVPITDYCNQRRLSPRERLELFLPVCQAVQHAHQKAIIHRDLKPSNVLVAQYDGRPAPKVIDFGVAKAAAQKLTERTLVTDFGALVGTLEYMSPEQAELDQLDVDTRSDIYSLGVLLYELLTGETPLDRQRFKEAGLLEILRWVREEEPPTPSDRLRSSPRLPTLSEQRSMEPARLARLVRGELDWIVMKTLEKDRNRRYATAAGLAEDIQHYLHDEPVQAGPPSAGYRLRKFLKRKRGPVLAAAIVFFTLAAGVIGTALGLVQAVQSRKDAEGAAEKLKGLNEELIVKERAAKFQALRAGSAGHAIQLDVILRAWERHDVAEAERVLDEVALDFQQTWEQRHLRELCHKVRRLAVQAGPHVLGVKGEGAGSVAAVRADGLVIAFAGRRDSFKTNAVASKPTDFKPAPDTEADSWEVRVYELATGRETLTLRTSLRDVTNLAFSPDGRRILLGASRVVGQLDPATGRVRLGTERGAQGFVEVFHAGTSQRLLSLHGKGWEELDTVQSVAFSPDGQHIAARSKDGQVSVWDAAAGRETLSLRGAPGGRIMRLTFSPDGRWIATVHANGGVWVWDGATGQQKFLLKQVRAPSGNSRVIFSPDGSRIALVNEGVMQVSDMATGRQKLITFAESYLRQELVFSRDGQLAFSAQPGGTVNVYDTTTGLAKKPLPGLPPLKAQEGGRGRPAMASREGRAVGGLAVSADGERLASGDGDGRVRIRNLTTGKEQVIRGEAASVSITTLAFSPDGRRLAFCEQGARPVKVWNLETNKVDTLEGTLFNENLQTFAFSADGKCLTAVEQRETVMEWDVATGALKSTLHAPVDTIALAYFADGPRLAARSADGSVYVQDAANGKRKFTLKTGLIGPISSVAFSPDSKRIATRNGDETVKVWDLATGREMFTLPGPLGDVSRESFSPDGIRIALAADGVGKVFDATEGRDEWRRQPDVKGRTNDETGARELFTVKSGASRLIRLAYSPDGQTLVSRNEDGQVSVCSPHNGQVMRSLKEDPGIVDVLFSPVGGRMAVVSGKRVQLWDSELPFTNRLFEFPGETVIGAVFTGNTAHFLADGPGGLRVWDETGQVRLTIQDGALGGVQSVAISPDGQLIAAGGQRNTVGVWNAATGDKKLALEWPNGDPIQLGWLGPVRVCFSPDGRRFAAATLIIHVLDARTGKDVFALSGHKNIIMSVLWSLDGRRIASSSMDGTVRVWDAQTGQPQSCLTLYKSGGEDPGLLAISPDGERIVVQGRYTKAPTVLDAATGDVKLTIKARPGKVRSATFSPDGQRMVTGEEDGTLRVWDAVSGEEQMVLKGHTGTVWSVAFSWDGQRIVSGANCKTEPGQPEAGELKVWDAVTGQAKLTLKGHAGPITGVAFSRDGQRLVSGSEDGTVKVWEAPAAESRTQR